MSDIIKIATFNANSIRARMDIIKNWLEETKTHILCIQETKVQDHDFPGQPFEELGYNYIFKGQKSYNGVAIISKYPIENIKTGFDGKGEDEGSRLICGHIKGINIINTYIPQGFEVGSEKFEYKLNWFDRLLEYVKTNYNPLSSLIWLGDFNVAPEKKDVFAPEKYYGGVGLHPDEHKKLDRFKEWGFKDIFRLHDTGPEKYSFFDYRLKDSVKNNLGWRLDHIWATENMAEKSQTCYIDVKPRLKEKPSDHTFVVAEFKI